MLGKGIAIARVDKKLYNREHEDFFIEIRNKKYSATKQTKAFYSGGHK
jgi:glycine cleavage system aminomethyltransferase T